jgi:trehalose 6-phosphate phosphatase
MRSILAQEARSELDRLATSCALLVFDFDGTLAPIVERPADACLRPRTRDLLRAVAVLYPCAVVSGRARADVAQRLRDVPLVAIVGNHGAEAGHGPVDRTRRARVVAWKALLLDAIGGEPGIEVEDKRFSLAVHYRHAPSRADARRRVIAATHRLEGARAFAGRAVVNVVPLDAPDKAAAVEEIRRRVGAARVLYVGDDTTDEDVFRDPRIEVAVRVGRTARSAARYYVAGQHAVDDLLCALLQARIRRDGAGARWEGLVRAVRVAGR